MVRFAMSILRVIALLVVSAPVLSAQSETLLYDHIHMAVPDPQEAAQWYRDHLGWRALDLNPKLEELRGKGVEITRGPNDLTFVNGQISVFFVAGPSGASIEMVQRAPNMR